jgi:hypothetical protein
LVVGPTTTDNGNAGFEVRVAVQVLPESPSTQVQVEFLDLLLYEDEEAGDTHMAVYVEVRSPFPGTNGEIFRWNNGNATVNEVNTYGLRTGGTPSTVRLSLYGPATVIARGFADDDQVWQSATSYENDLGADNIVIDPANLIFGRQTIGPTQTDYSNGFHRGYEIRVLLSASPFRATGRCHIRPPIK